MDRPETVSGQIDLVLVRLQRVKRTGRGWVARCPAHEDHDPSLSIAEGRSGILIHCWGGCPPEAVVEAMGLKWTDLFYDQRTLRSNEVRKRFRQPVSKRSLTIEARMTADRLQHEPDLLARLMEERGWHREALRRLRVGWDGERLTLPVVAADGKLHDVLRYDPFTKGRYKMLAGSGKSRLPWPTPEQLEQPKPPWPLVIVEGEGTAISLLSIGIAAVALPGAVSRPTGSFDRPGRFRGVGWHPAWTSRFSQFRRFALFPDDDESGRTLMNTVSTDLDMRGYKHDYVDLALGDGRDLGDVAKWARTGEQRRTLKQLILVAIDTQRGQPQQMDDARGLIYAWWAGVSGLPTAVD